MDGGASVIPKECKRLAEVDFPIAEVSRHAVREKFDPARASFDAAPVVGATTVGFVPGSVASRYCCRTRVTSIVHQASRRRRADIYHRLPVAVRMPRTRGCVRHCCSSSPDFANWDLAANQTYLEVSRALVKAAHGEEPPLVVDPFAGGGSIPLEALRLGL